MLFNMFPTVHFIAGTWVLERSPQDMDGVLYKNAAVEGRIVAQLHGGFRFERGETIPSYSTHQ